MRPGSRRPAWLASVAVLGLALAPLGAYAQAGTRADDDPREALTGTPENGLRPPIAEKRPVRLEKHGHVRVDDYYWLRERESPEVRAYLEAENAYTDSVMAHTEALRETLFEEIKGRIKETDSSVPYEKNGYFYYRRYEEGQEYPVYARRAGSPEALERVILDANERAGGHAYYAVRGIEPSSGGGILAFAEDTVGRRIYTVRFRDLETGEILPDELPGVTGNLAWANDDRTLFYARQDPVTLRSHQIWRHVLGTDPDGDELVYEEEDSTFSVRVLKSKSEAYLMIASWQTLSSEYRILRADRPDGTFRLFEPREREHEYRVEHRGDHFYVVTNLDARNFRLMRTPVERTGRSHWEEVIPHREDVLLEGIELFRDHLVVSEREDGLQRLRIRRLADGAEHHVRFEEPAYVLYPENNEELDSRRLRFGYTSLTTPASVYDYDMETRERTLLKRDEVVGGFDADDYTTERLWAEARDGERVPISVVYRKRARRPEGNPLLLYGYGSYGITIGPSFSSPRLSLLDRGFVFAIAHVRGGQMLGRRWYEAGKLERKRNTFTDFIDAAEHLVGAGYTTPGRLYAMGGSAGGLLVGAVLNLRPDLFHGAIAKVPFVDIVTTMLDESIPLTTSEYDEWGDPNVKRSYDYILSHSPYDNVRAGPYPHLLVTAGLHDSQVQYWEPAKWVAKLRALKTDGNRLLLKTEMEAGHGGPSGRYRRYRELAFDWAFLLDLAGATEVAPAAGAPGPTM